MRKAQVAIASARRSKKKDEPVSIERKKQTPDEIALTAKNYRLAKELSELRVRHREECKNVTRLTMENMNLAARCREAIQQVAGLKKELASHQRRSAEVLAMRRSESRSVVTESPDRSSAANNNEAVPTPASSPSPTRRLTDVAAEMDRMDRILAEHAAKASVAAPTATTQEVVVKKASPPRQSLEEKPLQQPSSIAKTHLVSSDDFEDEEGEDAFDESNDLMATAKETKEDWEDEKPKREPFFPLSASPKLVVNRGSYNEEYPGDIAVNRKPHRKLETTLDNFDEKDDDVTPFESLSQREDQSTMSSIDAFEASFNMSFPDSFSSTPKGDPRMEKSRRSPVSSEIYNPFSSSPQKIEGTASHDEMSAVWVSQQNRMMSHDEMSSGWGTNEIADRLYSPPVELNRTNSTDPPGKDRTSPRKSPRSSPQDSSKGTISVDTSKFLGLSGQMSPLSPSTPHGPTTSSMFSPDSYSTPPSVTSPTSSNGSEQPKRPEKAGYEAARARYEKALQPRDRKPEQAPSLKSPGSENNRNLSHYSSPVSPDKEALWGSSHSSVTPFDEEGDIPLHSNLSKKREIRISSTTTTASSTSSSNVVNGVSKPWEGTRDAELEATSPLARFRAMQQQRRKPYSYSD